MLTEVNDSVAVASQAAVVRPWDSNVCLLVDAPVAPPSEAATGRVPFTEGLSPEHRGMMPGYDSGIMAVVFAVFLLLSVNFSHYSTFLKTFAQDLWNVRRRMNNSSLGGHTVSETRIVFSLVALACTCEGILAYSLLHTRLFTGLPAVVGLLVCIGVAGVYYCFQTIAYNVTGYAFTDSESRLLWLRGFNASQSLLGLTLVVPALLTLFNPSLAATMAAAGIFFYAVARIIFVCKGFRLFYENLLSLLYFILYFCTLEIAPLVLMFKIH